MLSPRTPSKSGFPTLTWLAPVAQSFEQGQPLRNAVATSAALGLPIAIFASIGYVINGLHLQGMPAGSLGYVYLPAVLCVAGLSVFFAPVGARLAHTLPVKKIKRIFAILLTFIAVSMIYKATTGF